MSIIPVNNINHHFEVTIDGEPLSDLEMIWIHSVMDQTEFNLSISQSKRILLFDGIGDIKILASILSDLGIAEDVGLIREITDYYPIYEYEENQLDLFGKDE